MAHVLNGFQVLSLPHSECKPSLLERDDETATGRVMSFEHDDALVHSLQLYAVGKKEAARHFLRKYRDSNKEPQDLRGLQLTLTKLIADYLETEIGGGSKNWRSVHNELGILLNEHPSLNIVRGHWHIGILQQL